MQACCTCEGSGLGKLRRDLPTWYELDPGEGPRNGLSLKRGQSTIELLKDYQSHARAFREDIGFHINDYTATLRGQIAENYKVDDVLVVTINEMLRDMLAKRSALLKAQFGENRVNAENVSWVKDF